MRNSFFKACSSVQEPNRVPNRYGPGVAQLLLDRNQATGSFRESREASVDLFLGRRPQRNTEGLNPQANRLQRTGRGAIAEAKGRCRLRVPLCAILAERTGRGGTLTIGDCWLRVPLCAILAERTGRGGTLGIGEFPAPRSVVRDSYLEGLSASSIILDAVAPASTW